jgi:CelD/BcsL family acetyltransferase involved in cellulose biosynthesis
VQRACTSDDRPVAAGRFGREGHPLVLPPVIMRAALLEPGDPGWSELLARTRHDLYHLPDFADFATRWHEPGAPLAFVATEDDRVFFVPFVVRPIPDDVTNGEAWRDATGPRGYPGPIVGPAGADAGNDAFVERASACLAATLREHRIVTAFVRCHPLLSPPLDTLGRSGAVVEHGESVSIDLTRSADEVWSTMRENHRREIVRARRDGYQVRIDESWQRLDEFLAIYAAAMERLGAAEQWRLPRDYVLDLRAAVGPRVHLCVVEKDGDLAAAALLTEVDGIVEYHLAGTASDHATASPTKLLIEHAGRWARERGNRTFHLAGSLRHDDPLIHFKRGFSPLRHPVASWRLIADPVMYRRLVERWETLGGSLAPGGEDAGFFPAYRRPFETTLDDRR